MSFSKTSLDPVLGFGSTLKSLPVRSLNENRVPVDTLGASGSFSVLSIKPRICSTSIDGALNGFLSLPNVGVILAHCASVREFR